MRLSPFQCATALALVPSLALPLAITMQREDLTLSPSEVKVRYEMRDDTGQPVTLRVAFPMPEVPSDTAAGMTTSAGAHNVALRPPTDPNFLRFRVWADGYEIKPEIEIRAILPDGRDIAATLQEIGGLLLVLQPGVFPSPRTSRSTQRRARSSRRWARSKGSTVATRASACPGACGSPSTGCRPSPRASPSSSTATVR